MPEFRFRRKKQNRKNTVNNPEETAQQIREAKKLNNKPALLSDPPPPPPPPEQNGGLHIGRKNGLQVEHNDLPIEQNRLQIEQNGLPLGKPVGGLAGIREPVDRHTLTVGGLVGGGEEGRKGTEDQKRNSFVQEREKFFELLKTKYPEQAISLEVGVVGNGVIPRREQVQEAEEEEEEEEEGRGSKISPASKLMVNGDLSGDLGRGASDERTDEDSSAKMESPLSQSQSPLTSSSRYGECLYLRHGKSLRHCPMPSPITLSTIKNLYINMFDLNSALLTSPSFQIYVQDTKTMQWDKLHDISMVTDHCTLLLADSALSHTSSVNNSQADSDINMPLDHLTPSSVSSSISSQPKFAVIGPTQHGSHPVTNGYHGPSANGYHGNMMNVTHGYHDNITTDITPTPMECPKKNGLWRSGHTHQVQDLSSIPDHTPLQKNPPSLLPHTYPTPSSASSTTPSSNGSLMVSVSNKKLQLKARELQKSVQAIKSEVSSLRQAHSYKMAELEASIGHTSQRILAAVSAFGRAAGPRTGVKGEEFQLERSELYGLREGYDKCCQTTFKDLQFLEVAVENLRTDVVDRRCKVVESELNTLTKLLNTVTQSLKEIKCQYSPLEGKIRRVVERELQVIVEEEKFLEAEGPRLEEASERCDNMMKTLLTLLQVASVQSRRTPHIPYYHTADDPDRSGLMENITAIIPNHTHRLVSLAAAEELWEKKKELHSENRAKVKEFENILKAKKESLYKSVSNGDLDARREMKLKALYMEDKFRHGSKKVSVQERRPPGILKKSGRSWEGGEGMIGEGGSSSGVGVDMGGVRRGVAGEGSAVGVERTRAKAVEMKREVKGEGVVAGRGREVKGEDMVAGRGDTREVKSQEALLGGGMREDQKWKFKEAKNEEREVGKREVRRYKAFLDDEEEERKREEAREARSQEMLGRSREARSQEMFQEHQSKSQELYDVQDRLVGHGSRKPLLTKEDAWWGGGGGMASQEMDHSQASQHSLPPKLERIPRGGRGRGLSQDTTEQLYSHSQPEYYKPPKQQTGSAFSKTPPTKPRSKRPQPAAFEEGKRKSIGDVGELVKVQQYYDTLERKKHTSSSKESSPSVADSRGVAKHSAAYEERASSYLDTSYSGSSVVSTSTGSSISRPSCLKSSSLVTTSSTEPSSSVFTSSGSSGGLKISPLHNSHAATDKSSAREGKRSSIPRSQNSKLMTARSHNPDSHSDRVAAARKTKRPQINGFPSRYSIADHRHRSNSSKSETPSPPAVTTGSPHKRDQRLMFTKAPVASRGNSDDAVFSSQSSQDLKSENRTGVTKSEPRSKHVVVSHSDAPFHGAVSHSNAQFHGDYSDHNHMPQEELREIFDGDTLPVRRREHDRSKVKSREDRGQHSHFDVGGANQGSQSPSSSAHRSHASNPPEGHSRPPEGHSRPSEGRSRLPGRSHQQYTQHVPSAMRKHPPQDAPPTQGAQKTSRVTTRNAISQQQPGKNLRVQFKHDHHDDRPHPLLHKSSGIPMRATKSAQTPLASGDAPLTSYPRSHSYAMQQRSASNGKVQHHHAARAHPGYAYQEVRAHQGVHNPRRPELGGYGNNELNIGSLV